MPHTRHPKQHLHHNQKLRSHATAGFRLERWHRRSLYGFSSLLLISGVLWLIARYFLRVATEFGETIHPLEHIAMQIHGAAVIFTLFFVGSLLLQHIRRAYRARKNLTSAWLLIAALVILSITGYALYYLVNDANRTWVSLLHWTLGLMSPAILVAHIVLGRRAIKKIF